MRPKSTRDTGCSDNTSQPWAAPTARPFNNWSSVASLLMWHRRSAARLGDCVWTAAAIESGHGICTPARNVAARWRSRVSRNSGRKGILNRPFYKGWLLILLNELGFQQTIFLLFNFSLYFCTRFCKISLERCSSGWRGTPGKRVTGKTGSQVRILFSPQTQVGF